MHNAKERLALLGLRLIPALWSVNYIVARWASGVINPYTLALAAWPLGRGGGAAGGGGATRTVARARSSCGCVASVSGSGFCGVLVCGAWVYLGAQTTVAMNIALIFPGVYWVSRRQGLAGC